MQAAHRESHEAAIVSNELLHSNFKHASRDLLEEFHNHPKEFNHLLREINKDLHAGHKELNVIYDEHHKIKAIDFGGHDIYKAHGSAEEHIKPGKRVAATNGEGDNDTAGQADASQSGTDADARTAIADFQKQPNGVDVSNSVSLDGDARAKSTALDVSSELKVDPGYNANGTLTLDESTKTLFVTAGPTRLDGTRLTLAN